MHKIKVFYKLKSPQTTYIWMLGDFQIRPDLQELIQMCYS